MPRSLHRILTVPKVSRIFTDFMIIMIFMMFMIFMKFMIFVILGETGGSEVIYLQIDSVQNPRLLRGQILI